MDSRGPQDVVHRQHRSQTTQPPSSQQLQRQQQRQQQPVPSQQQPRNDVHQSVSSRQPPSLLPQTSSRQEHHRHPQTPRHAQITQPREQHLHMRPMSSEHVQRQSQSHSQPSLQSHELISDERKRKRKEHDDREKRSDVDPSKVVDSDADNNKQEKPVAAQKYQRDHSGQSRQRPVSAAATVDATTTTDITFGSGEYFPLDTGTLARSIKVDRMVVRIAPKTMEKDSALSETRNNSIIDLVSYVCANWKRQVDFLALTPAKQLQLYNRQYDQFSNVLSIALFSKSSNERQPAPPPPPPPPSTSVADADDNATTATAALKSIDKHSTRNRQHDKLSRQKQQTKPFKQSHNSDYEIIIFVHNNGRNLYRRVESAEKYAKRMKIPRYIRIAVKDEDAKAVIALLRTNDPTFVVNKEIRFNDGTTLSELHGELTKRIDEMSLENRPKVELVVEEDGGGGEEEEEDLHDNVKLQDEIEAAVTAIVEINANEYGPPPTKKMKHASRNSRQQPSQSRTDRKQRTVSMTKPKGGDVNFIGNNTRLSGVEMNTDIEDDDTTKAPMKENEKRKTVDNVDDGDNKTSNSNKSESDNDTTSDSDSNSSSSGGSSSGSSSSDEDDDKKNYNNENTQANAPHSQEEYVPVVSTKRTNPSSSPVTCYVPTPKTSLKRSHIDLPPSPLVAAAAAAASATAAVATDKSPGSLFPDTEAPSHETVVNKKKKHHLKGVM